MWEGRFENHTDTWLRWCDEKGVVITTAQERMRQTEERVRELEEALRRRKGSAPDQPPVS